VRENRKRARRRPTLAAPGTRRAAVEPPTGEAERERLAREFDARKRAQLAKAELELDHVDAAIFRNVLTYPAATQKQIGDLVGLSRRAVQARMYAPKLKRALEHANRPALEIFESNKPRAARVLADLLSDPNTQVRARAAIAHLWSEIHRETGTSGGDQFVAFIQEAFDRANAKGEASEPAAAAIALGGGPGETPA